MKRGLSEIMCPILFHLPAWPLLILAGVTAGIWIAEGFKEKGWRLVSASAIGAVLALLLGARAGWLSKQLPIQGYGTLILCGFLLGVWMARRRSMQIGVAPKHCTDIGLWGVLGGLTGARLLHIFNNWSHFNPFGEPGMEGLMRMFAIWEGGLAFFGTFIGGPLAAVIYCRWHKLPVIPFLDMAAPSLIAGQCLGRLGCMMRGCCFGRVTEGSLAIRFPEGAEAYNDHLYNGVIQRGAEYSLPVIPVQLYASLGAALIAAFLYAYWPRRRFDGQVFGLLVIMVSLTRFLEEFLRADDVAAFPSISQTLTISQWTVIFLFCVGAAWLAFFYRKGTLYQPPKPA